MNDMSKLSRLSLLSVEELLSLTKDAVIGVNRNQRIFLYNKAAERMFGYQSSEILGQLLSVLIPQSYLSTYKNHLEHASPGPDEVHFVAEQTELKGLRKNRMEFPAEASIARITRRGQNHLLIFMHDPTWRKLVENDMHKWSHAFENASWGVVITKEEGQVLETVNPAFARMHGYTVDELIGKPIGEIFTSQGRLKFHDLILKANDSGHIAYETWHFKKNGNAFPVLVDIIPVKDESKEVLYRIISVMDLTRRKLAEQILRESDEHYASMISAMEEGIVVQDDDGVIYTFNPSVERILELSGSQMIDQKPVDLLRNTDQMDESSLLGEIFPATVPSMAGMPKSSSRTSIPKSNGSKTWVSDYFQPLYHPSGANPYSILSSVSDIAEPLGSSLTKEYIEKKRIRELTPLMEVSRNVASNLELGPLLMLILTQVKKVVEFTGAGIAMQDDDRFVILEYYGPAPREKIVRMHFPASELPAFREAVESGAPVIIPDVKEDGSLSEKIKRHPEGLMETYLDYARSWVDIPLAAGEKNIGVLWLDYKTPGHFTQTHILLASGFAELIAVAIERDRLYERALALAALEERQKLARELHDSISQILYGIGLGARTALKMLEQEPLNAKEPIDYCLSLADSGLAEMRALIFELRPDAIEEEGLVAGLTKQTAAPQSRYAIRIVTNYKTEPQASLPVKEALFRIAVEALNNIVKHARASQVKVSLERTNGSIRMEVSDNVQGFDPAVTFPGHLGLKTMRERAKSIGGKFSIQSSRGKGSRVTVLVPVEH